MMSVGGRGLRVKLLLAACIVVTHVGSPIGAQEQVSPAVGTRLRLDLHTGERVTGTLVAHEADSIRLTAGRADEAMSVAIAAVRSYAVRQGKNRGRGAKVGALIGAAVALPLIALAVRADMECEDICVPFTVYVAPIGVIITGLGAIVGAIAAPARWSQPMPLGTPTGPRR